MLHKVKRNVAAMSTHAIENAEVQDYRQRLDGAAKALKAGLEETAATERNWTSLVGSNFVNFADRFATSYPDPDHMRVVAKETATTSLALLKTFNGRVESTTSQHKQLEALVRAYLAEIDGVEKDIKTTLQASKVELDMYAKKLETLQAKAGSGRDEAKIGRNLEKFEAARTAYDGAVEAVTARQKGIWEKRRVAFTALFCSFFAAQASAMSACMTTLSGTFAFVDDNQDALARLDEEMASWAAVEPVAAAAGGVKAIQALPPPPPAEVGESVTPPAPSSPAAAAEVPTATAEMPTATAEAPAAVASSAPAAA